MLLCFGRGFTVFSNNSCSCFLPVFSKWVYIVYTKNDFLLKMKQLQIKNVFSITISKIFQAIYNLHRKKIIAPLEILT